MSRKRPTRSEQKHPSLSRNDRKWKPRPFVSAIALPDATNEFERNVFLAILAVSTNDSTRTAYWSDAKTWFAFATERGFDPGRPPRGAVEAFVAWMQSRGEASKTRARRITALSSIFDRLCRSIEEDTPPIVGRNPFSVHHGPAREPAIVERPTPLAEVGIVRGILGTCGSDDLGVRDAAIVRVLWQTGLRRMSLLSMTRENLHRERDGSYLARVIGKRGKQQRVLIRGRAALALDAWLGILDGAKIVTGPIWLGKCGPMTCRDVNHVFERRLELIDAPKGALSPHMLRVSFLTRCPAPIDARQDAAAHSDPRTTASYDRASWRGREAFASMPELEDVDVVDDDEDKS